MPRLYDLVAPRQRGFIKFLFYNKLLQNPSPSQKYLLCNNSSVSSLEVIYNVRQQKMYNYLKDNGHTTVANYAQIAQVSHATARNDLKKFQKIGIIKKIGHARNTEYHLVESN